MLGGRDFGLWNCFSFLGRKMTGSTVQFIPVSTRCSWIRPAKSDGYRWRQSQTSPTGDDKPKLIRQLHTAEDLALFPFRDPHPSLHLVCLRLQRYVKKSLFLIRISSCFICSHLYRQDGHEEAQLTLHLRYKKLKKTPNEKHLPETYQWPQTSVLPQGCSHGMWTLPLKQFPQVPQHGCPQSRIPRHGSGHVCDNSSLYLSLSDSPTIQEQLELQLLLHWKRKLTIL